MTYLGSYLLMAKDTDGRMNPNNMLYLVYQVQSSANLPEDGIHQSFSYYYTVQFNNLTVSPDGKISVNLGEYSTSRDRFRKEFGNRICDHPKRSIPRFTGDDKRIPHRHDLRAKRRRNQPLKI